MTAPHTDLRKQIENTVLAVREIFEAAAYAAPERLAMMGYTGA